MPNQKLSDMDLQWDIQGHFWYTRDGLNVDPAWMFNQALELEAELSRLRQEYSTKLPPGLMIDYAYLDEMWQELVQERDELKRDKARLTTLLITRAGRLVWIISAGTVYAGR